MVAWLLATACSWSAATSGPSPVRIPQGFVRSADSTFGFAVALAPGWQRSGRDPQGGVSYSGPGALTMLVHFEQASSSRLDVAASTALAELTDAQGLHAASQSRTTLAGRPAERVQGQFAFAGGVQALAAYLLLEGPRAWVLALAGSLGAVESGTSTWETMVSTFRLVGARPAPPSRAVVGLRAPSFPLLERTRAPVVLNFFASWCVDCRGDMPVIARAAARDGGRFTLIGVDCCGDNPSSVKGFLEELGVRGQFRNVV